MIAKADSTHGCHAPPTPQKLLHLLPVSVSRAKPLVLVLHTDPKFGIQLTKMESETRSTMTMMARLGAL
jgi:hypothetical protein